MKWKTSRKKNTYLLLKDENLSNKFTKYLLFSSSFFSYANFVDYASRLCLGTLLTCIKSSIMFSGVSAISSCTMVTLCEEKQNQIEILQVWKQDLLIYRML